MILKAIINPNYKVVLLLLLLLNLFSCLKFLDVSPKNLVSDAVTWSSIENADLFLNNIYGGLPNRNGVDLENFSDNAIDGINQQTDSRTLYAQSIYTPSNTPSIWAEQYKNIRKCNLFIEKVSTSDLLASWKKQRLAESRFLRAYSYQMLWIWYGGVPIIPNVLSLETQGDNIFFARSNSEETFSFITNELDAIADDLPLTAVGGRITRGAALTLKGWCELYEASPLKNPSGNKSKWAIAAATNKKVIDLGIYSLFPDYNTLFYEENNNNIETILAKQHLGGTQLGNGIVSNNSVTFVNGSAKSWAYSNPTQELVDSYFMNNGLPITDPSSGYDPQNPYLNREKRFYQSIVFDGAMWLGFETVMKQGMGSRNATDMGDKDESSNSGYYWRKGLDPKYATVGNYLNSANTILFRYAEVLLNYAEAQNEVSGPDASIYDAINKVRERAALPPLNGGLSQEQMRIVIYQERRIELAFECERWFDLLRWKLAEEKLNGNLHAILIDKVNGVWVYKSVPAANGSRTFYPDKNYLMPIPQSAMDQNSKLTQNPGY